MKTPEIKKALRVVFKDGTSRGFKIGKYTQITKPLNKVLFHLDKLPDGSLLMIVGQDFVEDFGTVERIDVVRGD